MASREDRLADEWARQLRALQRHVGIPVVDSGQLVLLVHAAARPSNPRALASRLHTGQVGDAQELQRWTGAGEVAALDAAHVARLAHRLAAADACGDPAVLIRSGARSLRRYRRGEAFAVLERARRDVVRLRSVVDGFAAATALLAGGNHSRSKPSLATLVAALPVRLYVFAEWEVDPVTYLANCPGSELAAAVELGLAHHDDPATRALLSQLAAGATGDVEPPVSMVLAARCAVEGGTVGSSAGVAARELRAVARAGEAVAVFYGASRGACAASALMRAGRHSERAGVAPRPSGQRACLALSLAHPELTLELPVSLTGAALRAVIELAVSLTSERLRVAWNPLVSRAQHQVPSAEVRWLLGSDVAAPLVARALELAVVPGAWQLAAEPSGLRNYLDCVAAMPAEVADLARFCEDWFVELFRAGSAWVPALALAMVSRTRSASSFERGLASLHAVGRSLAARDSSLLAALEQWASVPEQLGEQERLLAELIGCSPLELAQLAHHRLLGGEAAALPTSLTKLQHAEQRRTRELEYLQDRLATHDPGVTGEQLVALEHRVQALLCRRSGLPAAQARRERNRLARALEVARRHSLDVVLDRVCREAMARLTGHVVPDGPLPRGFRDACQLLIAGGADLHVFREFLVDILAERPLATRAENLRWLQQARVAGVDVQAWLDGVDVTLDIGGTPVRFTSETDPLHVLRMGTYFDTCLSLDEGCNAASTLINAIDVNKHVIYGRRPDGVVVARKLIGATATGELAGYQTYASDHGVQVRRALGASLVRFAARCGMRLSDSATPEELHPGFWYDDGNERWDLPRPVPRPYEQLPDRLPQDTAAWCEWSRLEALRTGDESRLAQLAHGSDSHQAWLACFALLREYADAGPSSAPLPVERWPIEQWNAQWLAELLSLQAKFGWTRLCGAEQGAELCVAEIVLEYAPATRSGVAAAIEVARGSVGQLDDDCGLIIPAARICVGALDDLVDLYSELVRAQSALVDAGGAQVWAWARRWISIVSAAYLRERNPAPLVRAAAASDSRVVALAAAVAERFGVPGIAPLLRRRFTDAGRDEAIALGSALGTQADPADRARLHAALERWPGALRLAVGAHRCGVQQARELWAPPRELVASLRHREWLPLARELGSPRLARRMRRELVRELECERRGESRRRRPDVLTWLHHLGSLGAQEAACAPLAVAESVGLHDRPKAMAQARRAQRVWDAARWLADASGPLDAAAMEKLGRAGLLGDERVLAALAQGVAAGDELALGAWLTGEQGASAAERAELALGLLGGQRQQVSPELCRAAVSAVQVPGQFTSPAFIAWLEPLEVGARAELFAQGFPYDDSYTSAHYLRRSPTGWRQPG